MKWILPGTMLRFVEYEKEIALEAGDFAAAVVLLITRFPDLKNVLVDGTGRIRHMHALFLNDAMLPRGGVPDLPLAGNDVVQVLTAIAGGQD
jgi:molybdopterin synthase sulfur carrier subunit